MLTLVKPGVDAWRVASDTQHEEGQVFTAMGELTFAKVSASVVDGGLVTEEPNLTTLNNPNPLLTLATPPTPPSPQGD